MTKEENISTLNEHLDHWKRLLSEKICDQSEGEKTIDALQNAIKALEQKPCEDVVSRQAVLDALDKSKYSNEFCEEHHIDWSINLGMAHIVVNELKPVSPQPKMGKWLIKRVDGYDHAICSVCGDDSYLSPEWDALELYKYCPNCGTKMEV